MVERGPYLKGGKETMPALTGLRFLLAALVMLYHLGVQQMQRAPGWAGSIVSHGFLAVNAFFILSGFVLAQSYLDAPGNLRGSRAAFWIARFARIYPVYALTIIFSYPHRYEYGAGSFTGAGETIASISVFTLMQAWWPAYAVFVNTAAWSLSVEAFFYLCFPFVIRFVAGKGRRGLIGSMGACWMLLVIPTALSVMAGRGLLGPSPAALASTRDWAAFVQFNPVLHLPSFVMGIALQRLFALERGGKLVSSWRAGLLSGGALLLIGVILGAGWALPKPLVHKGLLAPLFAALIFGLASGRGLLAAALGHRAMVRLGEASYSVYLLHVPMQGVALAINRATLQLPVFSWSFLGLDFAITIGASVLALDFVEKPYRKSVSAGLGHLSLETIFQNAAWMKIFQRRQPLFRSHEGPARNQADEFAAGDSGAMERGLLAYGGENHRHRGALEVGKVHADLGQAPRLEANAHRLDARQPSV